MQPIINNNDSIIRSYANSLYWITNELYDIESRNLGYYNEIQTKITNLLKAKIIQFILDHLKSNENTKINNFLKQYFPYKTNFFESVINKFRKNIFNTNYIVELYVLSFIFDFPIIIYNNYNTIINIFYKGKININKKNIKKFNENLNRSIIIKMDIEIDNDIPKKIYSIYYI